MQTIGLDAIEIERFNRWKSYSVQRLLKIFTPEEIHYAQQNELQFAQRIAVRFAAKEAFYKAICQLIPEQEIPFLKLCQHVSIKRNVGHAPKMEINWDEIQKLFSVSFKKIPSATVSLTHTKSTAIAVVIISTL